MTSIPHLTPILQTLLTQTANEAAMATGFIRRTRAFTGAQFVQTVVFGWLANPDASVVDLVDVAHMLGVTISPQGLSNRFTDAAVATLERVLQAMLRVVVQTNPRVAPLLARFLAVLLHDSTTISLPADLADHFTGCGGAGGHGKAAIKAHLRLDLGRGRLEGPLFQDGKAHDRAVGFRERPAPGTLVIQDLGFFHLDDLARAHRDGRYWLTRLKSNTTVTVNGVRMSQCDALTQLGPGTHDVAVTLGAKQVPARLLVVPVPPEHAAKRQAGVIKENRSKGQRVSEDRLALCHWTVLVTNVPVDQLALAEARVLHAMRWQIELLFKLWKSEGGLDRTRGQRPGRVLVELYAKWIGLLIQHWLLLLGGIQQPEHSLPHAAAIVRRIALTLAVALSRRATLRAVLSTLQRQLDRVRPVARRGGKPIAAHLLANPALLAGS